MKTLPYRTIALAVSSAFLVAVGMSGSAAASTAPTKQEGAYGQVYLGSTLDGNADFSSAGAGDDVGLRSTTLGGAAFGYRLPLANGATFRTEIDASFSKAKAKGNDALSGDVYGVLANGWLDFDTGTLFTPYVGGGVGLGIVNPTGMNSESGLGYQAGGGILMDIPGTNAFLGVNYRYFGIDAEAGAFDADLDGHRATASLGINF